jgi:hypothetical protein
MAQQLAGRFGHAEDGYSKVFAEQVANEMLETMLGARR